jgi:hypothetical protein
MLGPVVGLQFMPNEAVTVRVTETVTDEGGALGDDIVTCPE